MLEMLPNADFNYSNNDAINSVIYLQSLHDKVFKSHDDGYNVIHS